MTMSVKGCVHIVVFRIKTHFCLVSSVAAVSSNASVFEPKLQCSSPSKPTNYTKASNEDLGTISSG